MPRGVDAFLACCLFPVEPPPAHSPVMGRLYPFWKFFWVRPPLFSKTIQKTTGPAVRAALGPPPSMVPRSLTTASVPMILAVWSGVGPGTSGSTPVHPSRRGVPFFSSVLLFTKTGPVSFGTPNLHLFFAFLPGGFCASRVSSSPSMFS